MTRTAHTPALDSATSDPVRLCSIEPGDLGAPGPAPVGEVIPLERKRLFTAFALTPLLAGFYPAIFLAEPSIMPIGLILASSALNSTR